MKKILAVLGSTLANLAHLMSNMGTIGAYGEVEPPKELRQ